MSQKAQPVADVTVGSWSPVPVSPNVNEPIPDDGTFVSSPGSVGGDTFEVKLAEMGEPGSGAHTLTVRLRLVGTDPLMVVVSVVQSNVVIAIRNVPSSSLTGDFTDFPVQLTEAEIEKITDYASLRVRVTVYSMSSSSRASISGSRGSADTSGSGGSGSRSASSGRSSSASMSRSGSNSGSRSPTSASSSMSSSGGSRSASQSGSRSSLTSGSMSSRSSSGSTSASGSMSTTSSSSGSSVSCAGLPKSIYMTVTSGNCIPGIPNLLLSTIDNIFWSGGATSSCNDGFGYNTGLRCDSTGIICTVGDGSNNYTGSAIVISTSPFLATFSYTPGTSGCCSPNKITLTFTI
jgi:hypothetical protein